MSHRRGISVGALAAVIVSVSLAVIPVAGQAQTATAAAYTPPRTPWGDPDIQGVYDFQTYVHLERPREWVGKTIRTEEELAAWVKSRTSTEPDWTPRNFVKDNRTSLITDPPDGRVPLSAEGAKRYLALEEYRRIHQQAYDTWEEVGTYERCISRVIPRLYQGYNSGTRIVQSPGYVTIVYEQLDTRIIPLDGRPHIDQKVRQWNGDSRGRWEGNTLVVEVTNLTDKQTGWPPMRDHGGGDDQLAKTGVPRGNLRMVERYTPVSATRLDYTVTNEDPTWYSRPWTIMIPWQRDDNYQIYEYACNEGNLAVENALRAARIEERSGKPYQPPEEVGGEERRGRPLDRLPR